MSTNTKPQKLRLASIASTGQKLALTTTGSVPVLSAAQFVDYSNPTSPFRGSLKDQILTGADASYVNMTAFSVQDQPGYKLGGAATYGAGGVGDNVVVSVQGGGNQTVDLSTVPAGRAGYMTALNTGLTGVQAINFDGKIKLVTTATGAAATATIVSVGAAAGTTTGLAAGAFTPGVSTQPQGSGATILQTETIEGPAWSPLKLPTLFAWLDSNGFVLDKSRNVKQWTDRGPNGYHATQTGSTHRPAHGQSARRGVEYLNLNGVNQVLTMLGTVTKAQPVDIFAVVRPSTLTSAGGGGAGVILDSGAGANTQCAMLDGGTTGVFAGALLTGPALNRADHIVNFSLNGGASLISVDGKPGTPGAAGANTLTAVLSIGNSPLPSNVGWTGRIYEIIVCFALLSAQDRLTLTGYLKSKYQIA